MCGRAGDRRGAASWGVGCDQRRRRRATAIVERHTSARLATGAARQPQFHRLRRGQRRFLPRSHLQHWRGSRPRLPLPPDALTVHQVPQRHSCHRQRARAMQPCAQRAALLQRLIALRAEPARPHRIAHASTHSTSPAADITQPCRSPPPCSVPSPFSGAPPAPRPCSWRTVPLSTWSVSPWLMSSKSSQTEGHGVLVERSGGRFPRADRDQPSRG